MSGGYFVFGDIKGGKSFKTVLSRLLERVAKPAPHVLYLGAANLNDIYHKTSFEKGLMAIAPNAHCSSLNLWSGMGFNEGDARPGKIEKRFSEADIVFFDGGGIEPLSGVFQRFNLSEYARAVRDHGGYVGGLCGGGSYLAEAVVYHENGDTSFQKGAGLISATSISCHMDREDQREQRLYWLRDSVRNGFMQFAVGISHNQGVVFENEDGPRSLPYDCLDMNPPFTLDAQGVRHTIPCVGMPA